MLKKSLAPLMGVALFLLLLNACGTKKDAVQAKPTLSPAEEVIEAYLNELGNRETLLALKDTTMTASLTVMGMTVPFSDTRKAPNKQLSEAKMGEQVMFRQCFDGEKGTMMQMGNTTPYDEKRLARSKEAVIIEELSLKERGVTLTFDGLVDLEGTPMNKLTYQYADGRKTAAFFDPTTKLKARSEITEASSKTPLTQVVKLSDYRDSGGIKFPYLISIESGPQVMTFKVDKVLINQNVSDDLFVVP